MITDNDIEVLKFLNKYGQTYLNVLGQTFFKNEQSARDRINKLYKQKIIKYKKTKLMTPRRAIILSKHGEKFLENELGITPKNYSINLSTIFHNVIEQITDFYLNQIGNTERTTIKTHYKNLNHIPDFIFINENDRKFYIEIETTIKSEKSYKKISLDTKKDSPYGIIYITENKKKIKTLSKKFGVDGKLHFIDIETLKNNILSHKLIKAYSQNFVFENQDLFS